MTHAWSILIVLAVSAVLFYAGVFEATGRSRFEGLDALALRPVPEQVRMYSDGVVVLTVLNNRPYSVSLDWVEVAPIADKDDVVRTLVDGVVNHGDLGFFELNATNLLGSISEASLFPIDVSAGESTVSFHICIRESHSGGGQLFEHTVCGKAWNIPVTETDFPDPCVYPGAHCPCETNDDCPLWCQVCDESPGEGKVCWNDHIDSSCSSQPNYICVPKDDMYGAECVDKGDYYG